MVDFAELIENTGPDLDQRRNALYDYVNDPNNDINARDYYGKTPLIYAAILGDSALIKGLILRGADLDIEDENNQTALDLAKEFKHPDVIKILNQEPPEEPDLYFEGAIKITAFALLAIATLPDAVVGLSKVAYWAPQYLWKNIIDGKPKLARPALENTKVGLSMLFSPITLPVSSITEGLSNLFGHQLAHGVNQIINDHDRALSLTQSFRKSPIHAHEWEKHVDQVYNNNTQMGFWDRAFTRAKGIAKFPLIALSIGLSPVAGIAYAASGCVVTAAGAAQWLGAVVINNKGWIKSAKNKLDVGPKMILSGLLAPLAVPLTLAGEVIYNIATGHNTAYGVLPLLQHNHKMLWKNPVKSPKIKATEDTERTRVIKEICEPILARHGFQLHQRNNSSNNIQRR